MIQLISYLATVKVEAIKCYLHIQSNIVTVYIDCGFTSSSFLSVKPLPVGNPYV